MEKITIREVGLMGFETIICRENHLRFKLEIDKNRIYVERVDEKWFVFSVNITDFILSGYFNAKVNDQSILIKEIYSTSELKKIIYETSLN